MDSTITQITLTEGYELKQIKKTREAKPHFSMVGSGRPFMRATRLPAVDLLYEVSQMTTAESFAFLAIRDRIKYISREDGYELFIPVSQKEFTQYQKKLFQAGAAALIKKDLIKRAKRGVYLVNPMAIVPGKNFGAAEATWRKYG